MPVPPTSGRTRRGHRIETSGRTEAVQSKGPLEVTGTVDTYTMLTRDLGYGMKAPCGPEASGVEAETVWNSICLHKSVIESTHVRQQRLSFSRRRCISLLSASKHTQSAVCAMAEAKGLELTDFGSLQVLRYAVVSKRSFTMSCKDRKLREAPDLTLTRRPARHVMHLMPA